MNRGRGQFRGRLVARFVPNPKLKFLDQCHEVMRFKQLATRTEETYLQWIRRFILFHRREGTTGQGTGGAVPASSKWVWRRPEDMGEPEVREFLTDLAVRRNVSAATQNQALNALVFLYREVLGGEMAWVDGFEQAHRSRRVPVVLSRQEVQELLKRLTGTQRLIGQMLYGTGMRLMEGLRLRVKDVDFAREGVGPGERVLTYLALNRRQAILSSLPPSVSSFTRLPGPTPCYGVIVKRRSVFRSSFLFSHSKRSFFSALFSFGSPSLAVLRFQ